MTEVVSRAIPALTPLEYIERRDLVTEPQHVEAMFNVLGVGVRVRSVNVELFQYWDAVYRAFRVRPGNADVVVNVGGRGDEEVLDSSTVTIEYDGEVRAWDGHETLLPPLTTPAFDRWVFLQGTVLCRAGLSVLVVGRPKTGKTSVALAGLGQGLSLLSDGLICLDAKDLLVCPYPKSLRLRRGALEMLSIDLAHPALVPFRTRDGSIEWRADPRALFGSRQATVAADIGAIVFLDEHNRGEMPALEPLSPGRALARLGEHLHQPPSQFLEAADALFRLCQRATAYELTLGPPKATARVIDDLLLE